MMFVGHVNTSQKERDVHNDFSLSQGTPVTGAFRGRMGITQFVVKRPFLLAVQDVHQLSQPPVIATVKPKPNSLQVQVIVVLALLGGRLNALDRRVRDDVRKVLIHRLNG